MEGRGVRLRLIAIYLIFKYLVLYCAVGQGFALTATSFFFDEQRKTKQKESSPCIFLDPPLRTHKGVEVNTTLKQTSTSPLAHLRYSAKMMG
ncbi:hypothetical protein, partial [Agarivorans sp.]|uniref:hypothetical protein n=1 Tax=Agarivorans sp. TaxID=1872412 RepID=UPI003D0030B6